jgi:hypothetical protein
MLPVGREGAARAMFSKHSISALVVVSNRLIGIAAGEATCDTAE